MLRRNIDGWWKISLVIMCSGNLGGYKISKHRMLLLESSFSFSSSSSSIPVVLARCCARHGTLKSWEHIVIQWTIVVISHRRGHGWELSITVDELLQKSLVITDERPAFAAYLSETKCLEFYKPPCASSDIFWGSCRTQGFFYWASCITIKQYPRRI